MYWLSRHRMLLLTLLVMVGGTVLCAVAAGHYAWRRALGDESSQVQRQLQLYGQGLQQRIDRFGTLPQVLALDRRAVRQKFEQRFSASRMAKDYVQVYRSLIKQQALPERDAPVSRRQPELEQGMN